MKTNFVAKLTTSLLMLGMIEAANATSVSIDFNSLPSAQGWTGQFSSSSPETSTFSVSGDVLTLNTIGGVLGGANGASGGYNQDDLINMNPFTISFRARVLQEETSAFYTPQTFYLRGFVNGEGYVITIGTSSIVLSNGDLLNFYSLDGTQFHDYVLSATPGTDAYTVTVDNSLVFNGNAYRRSISLNTIDFGDGSSTGNVHAEMTSYVFNQNSVPEPSTMALLSAGYVALIGKKLKKASA